MDERFDPRSLKLSMGDIIPDNSIETSISEALDEIEPAVEALTEDVSGIGQKAAERYLLRYEYGFATDVLASEFGVTKQTISTQVDTVRKKVLKYPRLARIIGTLRSHRASLSQPDFEDGQTWSGKTGLNGEPIKYSAEFKAGNPGRTYSWCYACESRYEKNGKIYHLFEDYLVDAIHGVFLKRLMWAYSRKSWDRPPIGDEYEYRAYALPNLKVPNSNGSLLDAAEYHWAYDTRNRFEQIIPEKKYKGDLESMAECGDSPLGGTAYSCRDDVLTHRIRNCDSPTEDVVNEYKETVHIRQNIERLLRTYPLDAPFDLPDDTISQLWNGQPAIKDNYDKTWRVDSQAQYLIAKDAEGVHNRDIYVSGTKHDIPMPRWNNDRSQ